MKNILVATDFSPKAQRASQVGMALAVQFKAEIHFLHVFHTPVDWSKLPKEHEERFSELLVQMGTKKAELSALEREAKGLGLDASTFLSYDHENMNVLQHTQAHKHDMIIIGSHSRLTITDVLFGSVAIDIVQKATVPVLLVDETSNFSLVSNIIVAVNPTSEPIAMVRDVGRIFPSQTITITAFSVNTKQPIDTKPLEDGLNIQLKKQAGPNVNYEVVPAKSVEQGIIEMANGSEADILVIGSNKFNSITDYLRKHVFPSISGRIGIPLLILR